MYFSQGCRVSHIRWYPTRLFEGNALIRRLVRIGALDESRMKLDYVLALKV